MADHNRFNVEIRLGNDAMQTNEDVATALVEITSQMQQGKHYGSVFDANGNIVGNWGISPRRVNA